MKSVSHSDELTYIPLSGFMVEMTTLIKSDWLITVPGDNSTPRQIFQELSPKDTTYISSIIYPIETETSTILSCNRSLLELKIRGIRALWHWQGLLFPIECLKCIAAIISIILDRIFFFSNDGYIS